MAGNTQDATSYNGVKQIHTFETDSGYEILPVAGRVPGFRRIRLHGGIGFRRVRWSSDRTGKPPIIPQATDIGTTDLLISHTVSPSLPAPSPENNGYQWHVEGEYLYVQQAPRVPGVHAIPTGGFPFPVAPMDYTASILAGPVISSFGGGLAGEGVSSILNGAAQATISDLYNRLGAKAIASQTDYVWPFTAIPAAFTSSSLFGA